MGEKRTYTGRGYNCETAEQNAYKELLKDKGRGNWTYRVTKQRRFTQGDTPTDCEIEITLDDDQ